MLLRSLPASARPRADLRSVQPCKHEHSESNRTHDAREAPNQALGAGKSHLDGLFRCRPCGSGQVRCGRPGGTGTEGSSGSCARRAGRRIRAHALRARHQQQNQHTMAKKCGAGADESAWQAEGAAAAAVRHWRELRARLRVSSGDQTPSIAPAARAARVSPTDSPRARPGAPAEGSRQELATAAAPCS